jgi:CRISPR/Cas system-associated endonuclease Cas1
MRSVLNSKKMRVGDKIGFKEGITLDNLYDVGISLLPLESVGTVSALIDEGIRVHFVTTNGSFLYYDFSMDWNIVKKLI